MTALLLLAALAAAQPVPPVTLTAAQADELRVQIEAFREKLQADLRPSATSYLAAAARKDLGFAKVKELAIGSGANDGIRLEGLKPGHLKLTLGSKWKAEAAEPFDHDGDSKTEAELESGWLTVGRYIVRLSKPAFGSVVVFDPKSPRLASYKPRKFYPVDFAYRFEAPLIPDPKQERFEIVTSNGQNRPVTRAGWFELLVKGKPVRLGAYREEGAGARQLAIYFQDATGGKETYKVGRYLYYPKALEDGRYAVDFNLAFNPVCAFSPYYACPFPRKEDKLPVPIPAGEKNWK